MFDRHGNVDGCGVACRPGTPVTRPSTMYARLYVLYNYKGIAGDRRLKNNAANDCTGNVQDSKRKHDIQARASDFCEFSIRLPIAETKIKFNWRY